MAAPVFFRQRKDDTIPVEESNDEYRSYFVIKVIAGPLVPELYHKTALSYWGVVNAYNRFKQRQLKNPRGTMDVVVTYNSRFLRREWCEKATVVFIAPTERATCINSLIKGSHLEYKNKYSQVDNFEDLAFNGEFD